MAVAAKLGAVDLIHAHLRGSKMKRYLQAGNGVLGHAHRDHLEGVDHVLGSERDNHGPVHRDVNFIVQRRQIVLSVRIAFIKTPRIVWSDKLHVLMTKYSIRTGIENIPVELLRDDAEDSGMMFRFGKRIHGSRPKPDG